MLTCECLSLLHVMAGHGGIVVVPDFMADAEAVLALLADGQIAEGLSEKTGEGTVGYRLTTLGWATWRSTQERPRRAS